MSETLESSSVRGKLTPFVLESGSVSSECSAFWGSSAKSRFFLGFFFAFFLTVNNRSQCCEPVEHNVSSNVATQLSPLVAHLYREWR